REVLLEFLVGHFAGEEHTLEKRGFAMVVAEFAAESCTPGQRAVVADKKEASPGMPCAQGGNDAQQYIGAFAAFEAAGVEHVDEVIQCVREGSAARAIFHTVRKEEETVIAKVEAVELAHRFDNGAAVGANAGSAFGDKDFGAGQVVIHALA